MRSRRAVAGALGIAAWLALVAGMVVAVPPGALAADDVVTIGSSAQLQRLAADVNAGNTYAGTTVRLARDLDLEDIANFTPIGTRAHPFNGSFEGNGHEIENLKVAGSSYLGLFGYIGAGGSVSGLELEDATVTATSETGVVKCVGSIAGYVYGAIGSDGFAISDCTSDATVTVTSAFAPSADKSETGLAPDSDIAAGTSDEGNAIEYIGGVVGYCAGSIEGTSYSGALSVTTHADPDGETPGIAKAVGGVAGQVGGYTVAEELEGGYVTNRPVYPTADGTGSTTGTVSTVSTCTNAGTVATVVDGDGGKDRFGEAVSAKLYSVGGVAGFAMADFSSCTNKGMVNSPSGDGTGGIVGALRAVTYTGTTTAAADAGVYKAKGAAESTRLEGPELAVSRCTNEGEVIALHAGGGIMGGGGTHTQVTECANLEGGNVYGIRWNKPMCGGIAGQTFGDVAFCYNRANCSSGLKGAGGGYFIAGVVGALDRYLESDGSEVDSPIPEISGCYATGQIYVGGTFRQAGICGENEGYIHDCYFILSHIAYASQLSSAAVADDYGTTTSTVVGVENESEKVTASDLMKTKAYTAKYNAPASYSDYQAGRHFVPAASSGQNDGYAVLAWQRADAVATIDEARLSAQGTGEAVYSAVHNPMPSLQVSYNGNALVEGADYYAVPDGAALGSDGKCRDVSETSGTTFQAAIVGIGGYSTGGEATSWSAPYTLAKGKFSTCSVSIKAKTFNFLAQYPSAPTDATDSDVVITDAAGTRVPADSFTMAADPGTCIDYHQVFASQSEDGKSHVGYPIVFTAKGDSNYEGTVTGYFQIGKAALIDPDNAKIGSITYGGKTWYWNFGNIFSGGSTTGYAYSVVDGKEVEGMQIPYSGESIKPVINDFEYKDGKGTYHELVQLTTDAQGNSNRSEADYSVVYGDPGDASTLISNDTDEPNLNVSSDEVGKRACLTFRYVAGATKNFTNYQNIFFDIVPADVSDSEQVTVTANDALDASSVVVKSYTGVTISADNYTVTEGTSKGKKTLTITGKDNLTGSITLSGPAVADDSETPAADDPTSPKTPAADDPTTPDTPAAQTVTSFSKGKISYKVTGAGTVSVTKIAKSAKNASIPATVKYGGTSYKVTAIAAKAAKGRTKLAKLTIGSRVAKIGKQAFHGCSKLKGVTIKTTKLKAGSIGSKAFAKIAAKAKVKVPKKKLAAYKKLLKKAGLPKGATVRK